MSANGRGDLAAVQFELACTSRAGRSTQWLRSRTGRSNKSTAGLLGATKATWLCSCPAGWEAKCEEKAFCPLQGIELDSSIQTPLGKTGLRAGAPQSPECELTSCLPAVCADDLDRQAEGNLLPLPTQPSNIEEHQGSQTSDHETERHPLDDYVSYSLNS